MSRSPWTPIVSDDCPFEAGSTFRILFSGDNAEIRHADRGQDVPILHKREHASERYVTAGVNESPATYQLTPEGDQFLASLLGLKDGDEVRQKDLTLLVERGWAILEPEPVEVVVEPAKVVAPRPVAARPPTPRRGEHRPAVVRRTRAREVALQVLYQFDQNAGVAPEDVDQFIHRRLKDEVLQRFAHRIVAGVREKQTQIDGLISNAAENWRIDRMAAIDRNILRLGAFEMLFDPEVPVKVAINEALELAKRYSTAQSSRFVNGILDRLQGADISATVSPVVERGE